MTTLAAASARRSSPSLSIARRGGGRRGVETAQALRVPGTQAVGDFGPELVDPGPDPGVEIELLDDAENEPPAHDELHSWRLFIAGIHESHSRAVDIDFKGHMPGHAHGMPTQPRVVAALAPGVFRVAGVRFQMPGWWVIEFVITGDEFSDTIRFDLRF